MYMALKALGCCTLDFSRSCTNLRSGMSIIHFVLPCFVNFLWKLQFAEIGKLIILCQLFPSLSRHHQIGCTSITRGQNGGAFLGKFFWVVEF